MTEVRSCILHTLYSPVISGDHSFPCSNTRSPAVLSRPRPAPSLSPSPFLFPATHAIGGFERLCPPQVPCSIYVGSYYTYSCLVLGRQLPRRSADPRHRRHRSSAVSSGSSPTVSSRVPPPRLLECLKTSSSSTSE